MENVTRRADLVPGVGHKDCAVDRIGRKTDVMGGLVGRTVTCVLAVSRARLDLLAMLG